MILDGQMELATAQDIGASGTAISENVYDRGNANADMTVGQEGTWYMQVSEAFTLLTSLDVTIESDSTADLATAPLVHLTRSIPLADLTVDSLHRIGKMSGEMSKRYVGGRFTVVGTAPGAGIVDLFFVREGQENPAT